MLTKDQILNADDLPREPVNVPEWGTGAVVYVRTMSGAERDAFEQSVLDAKRNGTTNLVNIRARLAVKVLCDEQGKRLFDDQDAEALGRKSSMVLDRVFAVAQKLNGIGPKDVEALEGN